MEDDDMWCETEAIDLESMFAIEKPIVRKSLLNVRPTRLIARFDEPMMEAIDATDTTCVVENEFKCSKEVKEARRLALEKQLIKIAHKENVCSGPGTLFIKKLTSNKLQWLEFVENNLPTQLDAVNLVRPQVLRLNAVNVSSFKFKMWEHYSEELCQANTDGIQLHDGVYVIMDDNCEIGKREIENALLACPNVDPKLLHEKWIGHHLSLILLKLAAMERSFPHKFARKTLTPENVMLQLKYRYDREIDHAQRSVLRKILEKDDAASKRMVLFVTQIVSDNEIELCDGHYLMRAGIDMALEKMISKKRIVIGTKIMLQGAEVIGLEEGCSPFEVRSF